MSTEIRRQYANKIFSKGELKRFALKLCRFLNVLPWEGSVFLRQKDQDFEIGSKVTIGEIENICEIGTVVSQMDFHLSYNIINLSCKSAQVLDVLYVINGNREYSERLIFFVENILEIKRHEGINQRQILAIDPPVLKLLEQVYEKETENTGGWTLEEYLHHVIQTHCQEVLNL
ncbi:hypothetical protein DP73_13360 [Desulfosporosinus sp. HMP52]|uniref:hypothetical protein n=1 Tax=Desulfosporosinus sp. HMP52 TaxID=1487923 RepID=UPI00051FE615|nr:hypothetical protein [Desulfosporosinus sp. HMP52]KGK88276.1 hypothetical protein DP73_13360 [Desulfosporosinus sp. HMP52]